MAADSTHYEDVYKWILKVIDSCDQYDQTYTTHRLIKNFYDTEYPTLETMLKLVLNRDLLIALSNKKLKLIEGYEK